MSKTGKLILWILVSSFIGSVIYGFTNEAGFHRTAEYWNDFYHVILGIGIGYFIFKED